MSGAAKAISELTAAVDGDLDATVLFEGVDNNGDSVKVTGAQLKVVLGNLAFTGHVTGTGPVGSIALTVADGVVTLAKMATMATNRLLGRSTTGTGTPEVISLGSGLILAAGVLSASASASAAPSATLYTHRSFGGF